MFLFPKQKVSNVGGILVGGQMDIPVVLIGAMFYPTQGIISTPKKGTFDRKRARALIERQTMLSRKTGIPCMIDVYADSDNSMRERLSFVSETMDGPFMIDSIVPDVRLAGVGYCEEAGLLDRAVYNSISLRITDKETRVLKDSGINSAILLSYNPKDNTINGRIKTIKRLLKISNEVGIKKPLIDTSVTVFGKKAGPSVRAATVMKSKFGLPVGNAIINIVSAMGMSKKGKREMAAITSSLPLLFGNDFLIYGPVEYAPEIFPVIAIAECLIAEAMEELGLPIDSNHPYSKLL